MSGAAHYDGNRGWVRFRYRALQLPARAEIQFNNFTADTLDLASRSDTILTEWTRRYKQPPDPIREWHIVRLYVAGEFVAVDTLRIGPRYGGPQSSILTSTSSSAPARSK